MKLLQALIILIIFHKYLIVSQNSCIPFEYCYLFWDNSIPCCKQFQNIQRKIEARATVPLTRSCGIEKKIGTTNSKIFGNYESVIGEFPWLGMIFYTRISRSECVCTLINWRYCLTAAHCVKGKNLDTAGRPSYVRFGEHNTDTDPDCTTNHLYKRTCAESPINVTIQTVIAHRSYSDTSFDQHYDIALLHLSSEIIFTDFINSICLTKHKLNLKTGTYLAASGWGRTPFASSSPIKLKTTLPLWNLTECSIVYKRLARSINESQLCAGGEKGSDTCRGDSGGPLMYFEENVKRWIIVGIVSFGPRQCGTEGTPGVYTNVEYYMDWIERNMNLDIA